MKTRTTSRTYQLGAAHERQSVLAKVRRERKHEERIGRTSSAVWHALHQLEEWIEERTERFSAKPGGLGRKRKAKSTAGKIKSAFGCKVPNV